MKQQKVYARSGQIVLVVVAALVLMIAAAVLAVDVGYLFTARANLQNGADAAAVAAAHELLESRFGGTGEGTARESARKEAQEIVEANCGGASTSVEFGEYTNGQFSAFDSSTPATGVRITAARDEKAPGGPLKTFFAPLLGMGTVEANADGIADMRYGIFKISSDLRPFSVPESAIEGVELGESFVFDIDHGEWTPLWDDEEYAPGNFGWLNLDGGAQGTTELTNWILDGYPGMFSIDPDTGYIWLDGTCGVRSSLKDELQGRVGIPMFICVHDKVEGSGANADFRVVSFVGITITDVDLTGKDKEITCRLNRFARVPVCEVDGGMPRGNLVKVVLAE